MERKADNAISGVTDLPSRNETAALEATGGDSDLARELLEALVEGLPKDLSELRRCFQASDWPLLTETAHRIRGATSYCGVPALDNYLLQLERTAKTGDQNRVELELAQVEREARQLVRIVGD